MIRPRYLLPFVLFLAACDRSSSSSGLSGEAFAADRPPVLEAAPAETIPTVTRRVWYGSEGDFLVGPTPDGKRLALTDWMTGDLAVVDLAKKDTVRLTRNVAPYQPGFGLFPRFSRDGRRVVFNWWNGDRPAEWQLRVSDAAGKSEPRVIYDGRNTPWIEAEDWSPDGRWILGWRATEDNVVQIVLVSAAGDSTRVLKTLDWRNPVRMNFSPDGRWIVYDFPPDKDTQERDVYALAVDGGRETRLVQHPAEDFVLGWAPDGSVLYLSDRTGTPSAWLLPVVDGRATGRPELVKPDMFQAFPIAFLKDGSYMYAIQTGTRDVFVATLDAKTGAIAGSPVKVTTRGLGSTQRPAWSPDGRHLAYVVGQGPPMLAPRKLAIRSLETGEVRELALSNRLGYVQSLRWFADGSSLLLNARDDKGRSSVFRFDVQTGRTEPLLQRTQGWGMRQVELTPDGAALVILEEEEANKPTQEKRIVARDLRSGNERVIFSMTTPYNEQIRSIAISPAGKDLAFVSWHGGTPTRPHDAMVIPLEGGEPRKVASAQMRSLRWGPDGRHLLFVELIDLFSLQSPTRLMRVSVDGGDPEPLGFTSEDIQDVRVHAPSRRIAFTAGRPQAELWIMSNFLRSARAKSAGASR
ncbi:MAG: PD40 domain-containing protein [Gemmatimonadetes bacterium]|nr:PD40 domain-containing protein [Gemmatimonadota bacterium]